MGDNYARGDISLREAAEVLELTVRDALELFWDMGISGLLHEALRRCGRVPDWGGSV